MQTKNKFSYLTALEASLFLSIVILRYMGYVPISSTPWLLLIAVTYLKLSHRTWRDFGLNTETLKSDIYLGTLLGIALQLFGTFIQEPFFDHLIGTKQDISQFDAIKQSIPLTIFMICLSWLLAGFGEEMVYRGYLLNRISETLGGNRASITVALILSSAIFAVGHKYQGPSGVLDAGFMGIYYGLISLLSGKRLMVSVITHGMNNTLGFAFLYLGFFD